MRLNCWTICGKGGLELAEETKELRQQLEGAGLPDDKREQINCQLVIGSPLRPVVNASTCPGASMKIVGSREHRRERVDDPQWIKALHEHIDENGQISEHYAILTVPSTRAWIANSILRVSGSFQLSKFKQCLLLTTLLCTVRKRPRKETKKL